MARWRPLAGQSVYPTDRGGGTLAFHPREAAWKRDSSTIPACKGAQTGPITAASMVLPIRLHPRAAGLSLAAAAVVAGAPPFRGGLRALGSR